MVADAMTEDTAGGVLMHEVGVHMAASGGKLAPLANRAALMVKSGKGAFFDDVRQKMAKAGETSPEEAAAYLVEAYENSRDSAPSAVKQWFNDFMAAVRAWLFKAGGGLILSANQLTAADIAAVARANARGFARGDGVGGGVDAGDRRFSFAGKMDSAIEVVDLRLDGWAGNKEQLRALAQGWYSANLQGKEPVFNRDMGVSVVFTSEGKGTAFATSGNLRSGWKAEMVKALPQLVARAVKVAESAPDERRTRDTRMFHTLVAPLSVNGTIYSAKITLREALEQVASPAHKFYDIAALEIDNGPEVYGLKDAGVNHDPLPTPSEPLTVTVRQLASAVNGQSKTWLLTAYEKGAGQGMSADTANFIDGGDTARPVSSTGSIVNQPTRSKPASDNQGTFDPENPDIRFSRRSAADIAGKVIDRAKQVADKATGKNFPRVSAMTDLTDDQRALLGKIGASPTPAADAIKAAADRAGLKIRQGVLDRYASLKELDEKALGKDFIGSAITNSSWVLAKMSSAGSGALNAMMKVGRIEFDSAQKVIGLKGEPNGGLTASLQKLGGAAEVERFFGWVAANRAEKLLGEGRENLFTPDEINAGKRLNMGRTEGGEARPLLYAKVFAEFQQYRDDILAIAEQAGIISDENRAMWRDEFYVPFYRVMEEDAATGGRSGGNGLSRQEAYKKLKGGRQNLNDLMENTLMNFHHLLSASLKNQAAAQAIRNAELVGIARKVPESRRDTATSTFVLEGGKKVFYEVDDPMVFESITTLADPGLNSTAVKVMGAFKRVFTQLTTATPQFIIANTFRDLLQASATSPTSKNIGMNLAQGIKGYRDEKTRAEMLASGGAFSFGHIYGMDADEVRASLRKTVAGAELVSHPSMVPAVLRKLWSAYGDVMDVSENVSRTATYIQNVEQLGKLRAAFEARDVMDFSQHGAYPAVRFLVRVVPFLNARLQGLDKLYRSGLKPSILTAMGKGTDTDKQAAARFAMVTGALTVATLALFMANADDEEYQKLEDWQKDSYWFFRIGNDAFFLPKPFEVGAIATLAERTLQQAIDDKATGKLFRERFTNMLMQTFAFSPVPQMFQPFLDVYANKDAFTGRDIETPGMERLSTGLRMRDTTTAPAKALSAATRVFGDDSPIAISPAQADHLIKGYLGGVGATSAGVLDTMLKAASGQESPDKAWSEYQPIRRFYRDLDVPVANTRYTTLFYDGLKEANRVYADVMELQKLGRIEDANQLRTEKRSVLQMRMQLNSQQRRLTEINNRLKEVRRSENDGEWKRREIDLLNTQKSKITEMMGRQIESARVTAE